MIGLVLLAVGLALVLVLLWLYGRRQSRIHGEMRDEED